MDEVEAAAPGIVKRTAGHVNLTQGRDALAAGEFMQVTQEVLAIAGDTCGTERLEPGLERMLAILQGNPESRREFENQMISLIDSPEEGVVEIISFLMHVLRWEVVREAVKERISHPLENVSNIRLYEAMLDSFSDSWRDRDLYTRFAGS